MGAGLDVDANTDCILNAGGLDVVKGPNTLLDYEVSLVTEMLIVSLPTIIINNQVERGEPTLTLPPAPPPLFPSSCCYWWGAAGGCA